MTATKAARRYWAFALAVGIILTVLGNGAHNFGIVAVPGTYVAAIVAATPPVMFAALVEGYYLVRLAVPIHVQRIVKLTVGTLGIGTFAVSYTSLRMFVIAQHGAMPEWTGYVIPGLLDTFVAVSGYVLFVLNAHGDVTEQRPPKRPQSALRKSLGGLSVDTVERLRTRVKTPPPTSTSSSAEHIVEPSWTPNGGSVLPSVEPPRVTPSTSTAPAMEPPTSSVTSTPTESTPSADEPINPAVEVFLPVGEWMVAEEIVARKTAIELATIIEAISRGLSDNAVKTSGLGSASTAEKVRAAWHRYQRLNGERPHLVTASG